MLATMLSSKFLLLWLLVTVPMQDPLCFSAQSGKPLFPDPGVNAGPVVPSNNLPGPKLYLEFLSSCSDWISLMLKGVLLLTAIILTRYEQWCNANFLLVYSLSRKCIDAQHYLNYKFSYSRDNIERSSTKLFRSRQYLKVSVI